MIKKIFFAALILSVCGVNVSAKNKNFNSQEEALECAKAEVVKTLEDELLSRIKGTLMLEKGKKPSFDDGMGESAQFLCKQSKVVKLYSNGKIGKNLMNWRKYIKN